ncbi:OLC1v1006053C1 [Oldenlandia corymbosa var. corymbosa]|uniref:RING-type E3 ubiquitin transferase n=1 Tax=Oldenlandia corymbosa var. corymbosa TaxID=529605 RepID=A0AAV1DIJ5_OLDCO|nr:OLC1v1006053C1 [Oldenlandia corymbosa var. corymbosa]
MMNLYYVCFGYRGRPRMNRGVINALISHNLRRLNLPPQLAYIAGGRFQGFRVQLSVLDRELELDDHPPIEVNEVPEIHPPSGPAMSAVEINALPASKYRLQNESTSEQGSSSSASAKGAMVVWEKCMICMDFLNDDDLVRCLPCDHQFHANCVDPWLKRRETCPVCKIPTMGEYGMGGSIPFGNDDHGTV